MTVAERCPTISGPYRCNQRAGHPGECECEAPSRPWVGPASRAQTRATVARIEEKAA